MLFAHYLCVFESQKCIIKTQRNRVLISNWGGNKLKYPTRKVINVVLKQPDRRENKVPHPIFETLFVQLEPILHT